MWSLNAEVYACENVTFKWDEFKYFEWFILYCFVLHNDVIIRFTEEFVYAIFTMNSNVYYLNKLKKDSWFLAPAQY